MNENKPNELSPWPSEYEYIDIPPSPNIRIGPSPIQGYGVFATNNIWTNDIVETATFVKTNYRQKHLVYPEIRDLLYSFPCGCDMCKFAGQNFIICSGSIQVYNGAESMESSNVKMHYIPKNRVIQVIATKPINEGEEILNYYGDNYKLTKE
jgi:hypothetical protein